MEISAVEIKALREKTGAGVMDCKRALTETGGDFEVACDVLRSWGLAVAEKKAGRITEQGLIETYVHTGGRIAVLVEVNCESDFVARTETFRELAHDLAMQVAATAPLYVNPEDASQGEESLPDECYLMLQPFIKDPTRTVRDIVTEAIARVGENIRVRRFVRFELGN